MKNKKTIVILGGGFGGIACAKKIARELRSDRDYEIVLIDRLPFHSFQPLLYEVATALAHKPEQDASLDDAAKHMVGIPYRTILAGSGVRFMHASICDLDPERRIVRTTKGSIKYDRAIVALGSVPFYRGIAGMAERSFPLVSFLDALRVNHQLHHLFQRAQTLSATEQRDSLRFCICGGGVSGVEVAAELVNATKHLCAQYSIPRENVSVHVYEAFSTVLPGLAPELIEAATKRLQSLGVEIHTNMRIEDCTDTCLVASTGTGKPQQLATSMIIWAGGVQVNPLIHEMNLPVDTKGKVLVDDYLQVKTSAPFSLFAVGDVARVLDANGKPLPGRVELAIEQGRYVGEQLARAIHKEANKPYRATNPATLIPLSGKFVVGSIWGATVTGVLGWLIRGAAHFRYFCTIVSPIRAVSIFFRGASVYTHND